MTFTIRKIIFQKKTKVIAFLVVSILLIGARFWKLSYVPEVINGDEAGGILHSMQLLSGQIGYFDLVQDGSVPALVYFPIIIGGKIFGINSLFYLNRITGVIFSLLTVLVFYLILRKEISYYISLFISFLFASSYWFLNFSRLPWIALQSVFWCLLLIFFIRIAFQKGNYKYFVLAGIAAAMVAMNYRGGIIYLLSVVFIVLLKFVKRKSLRVGIILFFISFVLFVTPFTMKAAKNKNYYFLRAKAVSLLNLNSNYYGFSKDDFKNIVLHQLKFTTRAFVFFDGRVSNEGIENQRLMPFKKPAVNYFIVFLFYLGIFVGFKKKNSVFFLSIYLLNIVLLQLPSVLIPSWSRALGILPAIYYFVALAVDWVLRHIRERLNFFLPGFIALFLFLSFGIGIWDFNTYWTWANSSVFLSAQEPAVSVNEYYQWNLAEWKWIKKGNPPFNIYEWQNKTFRDKVSESTF